MAMVTEPKLTNVSHKMYTFTKNRVYSPHDTMWDTKTFIKGCNQHTHFQTTEEVDLHLDRQSESGLEEWDYN